MLFIHEKKNGHGAIEQPYGESTEFQLPDIHHLNHELQLRLRNAGIKSSGFLTLLTLKDHRNQSVAFVFDDCSQVPLAVAKLGQDLTRSRALKRQIKTLDQLERILEAETGIRVPKALAFFESPPLSVALESYLPGSTAYFEMRNSWNALQEAPKHFRLALRWLIWFQNAAGLRSIHLSPPVISHQVVRPLEMLEAHGHPSAAEHRLIESTRIQARQLLGTKLIMAACHGDFWAGNLVNDNGSLGVIDWEDFESEALSLEDLFFFSITYGLNFPWKFGRWAAPQTAFRATYLQATEIAHLVRDYFFDYCRAMDIATELIEVFFPVFLAKKAMQGAFFENGNAEGCGDAAKRAGRHLPEIDSGTRSISDNMWRHFFRMYAERSEPACFSNRRERKTELR